MLTPQMTQRLMFTGFLIAIGSYSIPLNAHYGKPRCTRDSQCSDGNQCTLDKCDRGKCKNFIETGDICQVRGITGVCSQRGECICPPQPKQCKLDKQCNDNNSCTKDVCKKGRCQNNAQTGQACKVNETIGICLANGSCQVENQCTSHEQCNDNNLCTQDVCTNGQCQNNIQLGQACEIDGNVCTAGTCSPQAICVEAAVPNETICDDNNACTQQSTCENGTCVGNAPIICEASDQCHLPGTCNPATGLCSTAPAKPDGSTCDDDDTCTTEDMCTEGVCGGTAKGERIVFVTSTTTVPSTIGGLIGADAICNQLATQANLPGTYKAWISDSTGTPQSRFTQCGGPFNLTTGTTIANNWSDLIDGNLASPINTDENGTPITITDIFSTIVWTGTSATGQLVVSGGVNFTCSDWSSNSNTLGVIFGNLGNQDSSWSSSGISNCANNFEGRLYCFEQ